MVSVAFAIACILARAEAQPAPAQWPDSYASRVEIVALLQTLNADILAASSATRSLERWCRDHEMAAQPSIVARRVPGIVKTPSAEQLQRLQVNDASQVAYRRVQLQCGAHVLSEADNWYVPARLSGEMNRLLDETDAPFGRVVQPLRPYRRTIDVTTLWSPLPQGWEQQRRRRWRWRRPGTMRIPRELFVHRAVLYTADHQPFSEVVETYQSGLLAFERER
jgi:chorismate-pyruvate lyase